MEENEDWLRRFYESVGFKFAGGPYEASWTEKDTKKDFYYSVFFKKTL